MEGDAEGVFPRKAELALTAVDPRVEDHFVPGLHPGDPPAHRIDHSRPVRSHHVGERHRDAGDAVSDEDVEVIERGRLDSHADLPRPGGRFRKVTELYAVRPAVFAEKCGFHGTPPCRKGTSY